MGLPTLLVRDINHNPMIEKLEYCKKRHTLAQTCVHDIHCRDGDMIDVILSKQNEIIDALNAWAERYGALETPVGEPSGTERRGPEEHQTKQQQVRSD